MTKKEVNIEENSTCLNCNHDLSKADKFCTNCGQRAGGIRISFFAVIANFFANVFNFESKFIQTIKALAIPGKISRDYIDGKRIRYYSPGRIFFVSLIFFFFLLARTISFLGNTDEWNLNFGPLSHDTLISGMDSTINNFELKLADSIVDFDTMQQRDTLNSEDPIQIQLPDSVRLDTKFQKFLTQSEEDFIKENPGLNKSELFLLKQMKKSVNDVKGAVFFVIGNLSWMFLLMAISLGAFMKILYIRRKHYYAEHVIFQMHFLSFGVILGSIFLIATLIQQKFSPQVLAGFTIAAGIYLLIAQKRYYNQGIIKTFFKYIILLLGYVASFTTFMLLIALVSFLFL